MGCVEFDVVFVVVNVDIIVEWLLFGLDEIVWECGSNFLSGEW